MFWKCYCFKVTLATNDNCFTITVSRNLCWGQIPGDHESLSIVCRVGLHVNLSSMKYFVDFYAFHLLVWRKLPPFRPTRATLGCIFIGKRNEMINAIDIHGTICFPFVNNNCGYRLSARSTLLISKISIPNKKQKFTYETLKKNTTYLREGGTQHDIIILFSLLNGNALFLELS